MNKLIFALLTLLLGACASKGDTPYQVNQKPMNSVWVATSPNWTFSMQDLSSEVGVSFPLMETYLSGGSCQSTAVITSYNDPDEHDLSSGVMNFNSSWVIPGKSAPGMPSCAQFDGDWAFSYLVTGVLQLCQSGKPCVEFH